MVLNGWYLLRFFIYGLILFGVLGYLSDLGSGSLIFAILGGVNLVISGIAANTLCSIFKDSDK
jgi:hypothetical protein